jgi:hypothetical protein
MYKWKCFALITKGVCPNYNLNGDVDPVRDLSPRGTGMGKKCPPQAFMGMPTGKNLRRRDEYGKLLPNGEFPIAIPSYQLITG